MSLTSLLSKLSSAGLSLDVEQGNLKLRGPRDAITDELVAGLKANKLELIQHLELTRHSFPLTPLQSAYISGRSEGFELGGISNQVYHEIEGLWDVDRLQSALNEVWQTHSALRSEFLDETRQREVSGDIELLMSDWQSYAPDQQKLKRAQKRRVLSNLCMPLGGPLIRLEVVKLDQKRMVLFLNHDGLVMDGISMFLFFNALSASYRGQPRQSDQLVFRDYVESISKERDGPAYLRSKAYWLERIPNLAQAPKLPLPSRPAAPADNRFSQRSVTLNPQEWEGVKRQFSEQGLTPSAGLLFVWAQVLKYWGAGDCFTLNVTVANRRPMHQAAYTAIGPFSDPMLVEVKLDDSLTLMQVAEAVQARLHADLDHRHFSGIEVMKELARQAGGPSASSMPFTFNSTVGALGGVDGTALGALGTEVYCVSQTPQVLLDVFVMEQAGNLVIRLDAIESRFHHGMVGDMGEGYANALRQLTSRDAWLQRSLDLLPESQRARRETVNSTASPYDAGFLSDAFIRYAKENPTAIALMTSTASFTYQTLSQRAFATAAWLVNKGVQRNELVAVHALKGPNQIVGILGTIIAGAAYLPVDSALPESRKAYMLTDANVRFVLTDSLYTGDLVNLRLDQELFADEPPPRAAGSSVDDMAYALYTSGTTGDPKGVMVTHRSVANVVADCEHRFKITSADRLFAISAFNFDLSVWDVFGSLSAGAALVIPDHDRVGDPAHWHVLCERSGVTIWNSVPSVVQMLLDHSNELPSRLRLVMMSGDKIPVALAVRIAAAAPEIHMVSLGGPTETTIWNMVHSISEEDLKSLTIPYGKPNSNNSAHIRDSTNRDRPDWVAGEICSGGVGVTIGYLGDERKTAEKYQHDEHTGERFFRTGDRGRYLPDGNIEILGRVDHQLKVNGYRVEAAEVEARLGEIAGILQVAVVTKVEPHGNTLVAHLVAQDKAPRDIVAIKSRLSKSLPEYMIPSRYVWHSCLPRNRNEKIDRAALIDYQSEPQPSVIIPNDNAPYSELRHLVLGIWASILRRPETNIGFDADFFELGGTSMAAVRVLTSVRKACGVGLPVDALYRFNTVDALARELSNSIAEKEAAAK